MKFKIHHPKLLVVVLLLIIGLTSTAVLLAGCQGNSSSEPPVFPEMPINAQLTEPDKQEAVDIARNSGIVRDINGDQDWEATEIYRHKIEGAEGIRIIAKWETPVMSDGPWELVRCQGSRKLAVSSQVSNITLLAVYVDMGTREVVGYGVSTPDDEEPGLRGNVDPVFSPRMVTLSCRSMTIRAERRYTTGSVRTWDAFVLLESPTTSRLAQSL